MEMEAKNNWDHNWAIDAWHFLFVCCIYKEGGFRTKSKKGAALRFVICCISSFAPSNI